MLQLLAAEPPPRDAARSAPWCSPPTRELAIQIDECCRDYARYTPHPPLRDLRRRQPASAGRRAQKGVDLLVATPGRLLDLIGQGYVTLDTIRFFVLDEADRMLDMGFIHDIRRILPLLPERRQTLLLGHDARVDRRAGRENPPQPGAGHRHAPGVGGRDHRADGPFRRKSRKKASC